MKKLFLIFFAVLPVGVLGGINLGHGVTVYLHDIVLLILVLETVRRGNLKLKSLTLTRPVAAFIAAGIISLLFNFGGLKVYDLALSSLYLLRFVFYFSAYLVVSASEISTDWLVEGVWLSGMVFLLFGFGQYLVFPDLRSLTILGWDPHYYRLTSTFLDPNFAAAYLVLTFFMTFYIFRNNYKKALIFAAPLIIGLYLTHSRSGYLAFIGGAVTGALLLRKMKILLAVGLMVLVVLLIPKGRYDVTDLFRRDTAYARINNWDKSIGMFMKSPVFGYGFDTLRYTSSLVETDSGTTFSHSAAGVDNSLLLIAVTTGILGIAAFGYIISRWFYLARTTYKNKKVSGMGILFYTSVVAVLIHSMFNNSLFFPWIILNLWILAAITEKSAKSAGK